MNLFKEGVFLFHMTWTSNHIIKNKENTSHVRVQLDQKSKSVIPSFLLPAKLKDTLYMLHCFCCCYNVSIMLHATVSFKQQTISGSRKFVRKGRREENSSKVSINGCRLQCDKHTKYLRCC